MRTKWNKIKYEFVRRGLTPRGYIRNLINALRTTNRIVWNPASNMAQIGITGGSGYSGGMAGGAGFSMGSGYSGGSGYTTTTYTVG